MTVCAATTYLELDLETDEGFPCNRVQAGSTTAGLKHFEPLDCGTDFTHESMKSCWFEVFAGETSCSRAVYPQAAASTSNAAFALPDGIAARDNRHLVDARRWFDALLSGLGWAALLGLIE
ncbi:hypothetical protein [uncultured Roseobacter sp.]|uniref:hypothetical protein n=1 Tax=uncultured Roseobacter sp. TaxID=114847 RepID=UPI0026265EC6|nr:hypothetical protein [uncultured Roseobacter sp.]